MLSLDWPPPHLLSSLPSAPGGSLGWTTSTSSVLSGSWLGLAKGNTAQGREDRRRERPG